MELHEIETKILNLINSGLMPQSISEIGEQLGITKNAIAVALRRLESEGLITRVGNSKTREYYIPVKSLKEIDPTNLEQIDKEINDLTADAKDQYANIKEKTNDLEIRMKEFDGKMNSFYVNIISIMAVFVAIFSLININIKIVADVATTISWGVLATCAIISVSAIILIWIMLLILKKLIINPLMDGGTSDGRK